jgi:lipoprotein-releasing system permease protein
VEAREERSIRGARFEFFVALRYLSAKRREAAISAITAISILGVAAGVAALLVALAVNNGFRNTLQRNLLGATAHVSVLEKEPGAGIAAWRDLIARFGRLPGVAAASPVLYGAVFFAGPMQSRGAILKGIDVTAEMQASDTLKTLKSGSAARLRENSPMPGIILGARLAQETGMVQDSVVTVISPQGELTPFGPRPSYRRFRVVGIFESGFYEFDAGWAYTSLRAAQETLSVEDVVNQIELRVADLNRAPEIAKAAEAAAGPGLAATNWQEQNRQLLNALKMERIVSVVTIGLIEIVAALNIFIALVMMVMEKRRDIAVLMAMGARREQVVRVFMLQGLLIGAAGAAIGVAAGRALCLIGDKYRLLRLDEQIYALSYVPFEPRTGDTLWVPAAAILVSFLATIYPARSAARVAPAEVLRYE